MPKRMDIEKIGSWVRGPLSSARRANSITQGHGVRRLREEGYQVILVNSNPATIMTDPEMAGSIAPISNPSLPRSSSIIARNASMRYSRRWAVRPRLNIAVALAESGVLECRGGTDRREARRHP